MNNVDPLKIDDCDDAIIGIASRCGQVPLLVYDRSKLVQCFVDQGMSVDDADEWVSFNVEGAWMGEGTPIIFNQMSPEESLDFIGDCCSINE